MTILSDEQLAYMAGTGPAIIDSHLIANARILELEGYLLKANNALVAVMAASRAALAKARNDALEEAARVADSWVSGPVSKEIRALKTEVKPC